MDYNAKLVPNSESDDITLCDFLYPEQACLSVSDFPRFEYSLKKVAKVGKALAGNLPWTPDTEDDIREVFRIAYNWRDSHALPMRRMRYELMGKIRRNKINGITAARLKRMTSIRKKLCEQNVKLNQMQDLGGCRAIVNNIDEVKMLVDSYRLDSNHNLYNESHYIDYPRIGGYRSHHLLFKFAGKGDELPYHGRRIEVQIRSKLQHSWATAVESVGMLRAEDLKGGKGNTEWLRLFELMAAEFALIEKSPMPPNVPQRRHRIQELRDLNENLEAVSTLENLRNAVRGTDRIYSPSMDKPEYYLIKYDNLTKTVDVRPYSIASKAAASYDEAEQNAEMNRNGSTNVVFVEVDEVENLKKAYPNYFGDVEWFETILRRVVHGKDVSQYAMPPQERAASKLKDRPDDSWLRKRRRRWS